MTIVIIILAALSLYLLFKPAPKPKLDWNEWVMVPSFQEFFSLTEEQAWQLLERVDQEDCEGDALWKRTEELAEALRSAPKNPGAPQKD